jgi:hypothetical protein
MSTKSSSLEEGSSSIGKIPNENQQIGNLRGSKFTLLHKPICLALVIIGAICFTATVSCLIAHFASHSFLNTFEISLLSAIGGSVSILLMMGGSFGLYKIAHPPSPPSNKVSQNPIEEDQSTLRAKIGFARVYLFSVKKLTESEREELSEITERDGGSLWADDDDYAVLDVTGSSELPNKIYLPYRLINGLSDQARLELKYRDQPCEFIIDQKSASGKMGKLGYEQALQFVEFARNKNITSSK